MKAAIRMMTCAALASSTLVVFAQGPQTTTAEGEKIAISGCIQRAGAQQRPTATAAKTTMSTESRQFVMSRATRVGVPGVVNAVDKSGPSSAATYSLDGSDSMLAPYINQKVQITGTVPKGAPSAGAQTVKVDTVLKLADSCS